VPASPRFFIENTAVSNHNVRIEIDRCISKSKSKIYGIL